MSLFRHQRPMNREFSHYGDHIGVPKQRNSGHVVACLTSVSSRVIAGKLEREP